jgi:alcohol dehydrogenase class IV
MRFEFTTSNHILFGPGTCAEVPPLAATLGRRVFVVTDSYERCRALLNRLLAWGMGVDYFVVEGEVVFNDVVLAMRNAREFGCQLLIGFGGGSALDTGKATAALMVNPGDPLDYLEVVGSGRPLGIPSIPYIAIPTTAGTGSEVTRNAVIAVPEKRLKVSLRSPYMLPKIAVIDPELTYSLPPSITASTGMDALSQLIEPFVCNSPTPLTDALCRDGIARAARSLRKAYENGLDINAREDMALVSLFGGMALANARLGAVHGMASPIGGMSHAPHGAVCARLLPLVMETNQRTLRTRQPDSPSLIRYTEVARLLTGDATARAEDGTAWVRELCVALNIRPLSEYGLEVDDYPVLVEQSQKATSMKGNPVTLTDAELLAILVEAA